MTTARVLVAAVLAVLLSLGAWAQGTAAQTGKLDGFVRSKHGKAIPNARVAVVKENDPQAPHATTDPQGHFVLADLPPGAYTLEVSAAGFTTQRREGVKVEAGKALKIAFGLEEAAAPAEIVAIVMGPDGVPADGARCTIKQGPSLQGQVIRAKSGGVLQIAGLAPGTYVLSLGKPGVGGLELKDFKLEPGQKYTGQLKLDASLAPALVGTVKVTVRSAAQVPIAKARVVLFDPDRKQRPRIQESNDQGEAAFEDLPPMTFGLMVNKQGMRRFFKRDIVVKAGEETVVEATLVPAPGPPAR